MFPFGFCHRGGRRILGAVRLMLRRGGCSLAFPFLLVRWFVEVIRNIGVSNVSNRGGWVLPKLCMVSSRAANLEVSVSRTVASLSHVGNDDIV